MNNAAIKIRPKISFQYRVYFPLDIHPEVKKRNNKGREENSFVIIDIGEFFKEIYLVRGGGEILL